MQRRGDGWSDRMAGTQGLCKRQNLYNALNWNVNLLITEKIAPILSIAITAITISTLRYAYTMTNSSRCTPPTSRWCARTFDALPDLVVRIRSPLLRHVETRRRIALYRTPMEVTRRVRQARAAWASGAAWRQRGLGDLRRPCGEALRATRSRMQCVTR
jgi:hypothetical protein